jgi:hypothetical protein
MARVSGPSPIGLPGEPLCVPTAEESPPARSSTRYGCTGTGPAPGGNMVSLVAKYSCSFLATACRAVQARRSGRFAVFRAHNPPGVRWSIAGKFRAIEGTRFAFDHRHLYPERCETRFPAGRGGRTGRRAQDPLAGRSRDHLSGCPAASDRKPQGSRPDRGGWFRCVVSPAHTSRPMVSNSWTS